MFWWYIYIFWLLYLAPVKEEPRTGREMEDFAKVEGQLPSSDDQFPGYLNTFPSLFLFSQSAPYSTCPLLTSLLYIQKLRSRHSCQEEGNLFFPWIAATGSDSKARRPIESREDGRIVSSRSLYLGHPTGYCYPILDQDKRGNFLGWLLG